MTRLGKWPASEWPAPQSKIALMSIPWRFLTVAVLSLAAAPRGCPGPCDPGARPAGPAVRHGVRHRDRAARTAARRLRPRRPLHAPCFEAQGNVSLIEPQTYLYYIQLKTSRPSEGVWVPYDETSEKMILDDFHRLWNTNFLDNISIDDERLHVPQRGDRQDRHLQHGGAAAGQDRRLHRLEEGRDLEDRREAEGSQRGDPPRHLHRSRPGPEGRGHRPRDDEREGLPVRQRDARDQGRSTAARSWCTSRSRWTRGRRSRSGRSTSSATRRSATASSSGR